ncbi:5'-3' exoribonuclease 1-like isoform X2 [Eriocheir sinensis]|uniref:5'-3' exoribonuclease 1-like isoform X2 n=1 Tax=Eriocheir sinensis TaxID=95602 RepID=UPI0021C99E12|nr:5'-3' exoribonuclease 1-like isoform X2 [Eriocheir sinensis]
MGVPKFYRWISERYPCLSEVVKEYQIPEFDNLYLDMNGIIHICSHPNDNDPHFRISEEKMFKDIFHYIEVLFRLVQPRKVFFMAVDGVAPRAKMNQQRSRRFRSARAAIDAEKKAQERGEVLPTEERFDSNCITPGTDFMERLDGQLQYFVTSKVSQDKMWQDCKIIYSGHQTPGEGEHKIMEYIRFTKSSPDYNPNTRHCLYGLDADLIILGLTSHEPHFSLLREEVRFGGKKDNQRTPTPEETTFHLLHLSLMREYINYEFYDLRAALPFPYDLESVIDDWVLMGFLVGNDFIPHLPHLHINKEALPKLYMTYKAVLPTLDGYLNQGGELHLGRFEKFMAKLSEFDFENFQETYADQKYFNSKRLKDGEAFKPNRGNRELEPFSFDDEEGGEGGQNGNLIGGIEEDEEDDQVEDLRRTYERLGYEPNPEFLEDEDEDETSEEEGLFKEEFRLHKREYYMTKMNLKRVNTEVLHHQATSYVRAIQWILNYYYNGICSWSWYYPFHYAPFISDVRNFAHMKMDFEMGHPFLPYQQLLAVLPPLSKKLLSKAYWGLMCNEDSPLKEFYPSTFLTDLNGKQQDWEAVVLIPFIDETKLLEAMETCNTYLTEEERNRNSHGPMYIYTYTEKNLGDFPAPKYFPGVNMNHAQVEKVWRETWELPPHKIKKGLCPDVRQDIYFAGFPTLKHVDHKFHVAKEAVKVFQQNSRGENFILDVTEKDRPDLRDLANQLLGKEVFVSWPHLQEAKVEAVSDSKVRYSLGGNGEVQKHAVEHTLKEEFSGSRNFMSAFYHDRWGVDVGDIHILIYATPMTGRKYVAGPSGRMTLEKTWSKVVQPYCLQTLVKDIGVHNPGYKMHLTPQEYFPPRTKVFMLGQPHYGSLGEVIEIDPNHKGRIRVAMTVANEPNFDMVRSKQGQLSDRYLTGYHSAQRLGMSSHLFSRLTGTVFLAPPTTSMAPGDMEIRNKLNIGLNLKNNKKNEEVNGYSRKVQENSDRPTWMYAEKAIQAMMEYQEKFPEIFDHLSVNIGQQDIFYQDQVFGDNHKEKVAELTDWLKKSDFAKAERQPCGTLALSEAMVACLAEEVDKVKTIRAKIVKMQVRPHLLFKPNPLQGSTPPDHTVNFEMFDRVVNVREGFSVPLGARGTIIGIQPAEKQADMLYDILFDEAFPGGLTLRGPASAQRCYSLHWAAIINVSHGSRSPSSQGAPPTQRYQTSQENRWSRPPSLLPPRNENQRNENFRGDNQNSGAGVWRQQFPRGYESQPHQQQQMPPKQQQQQQQQPPRGIVTVAQSAPSHPGPQTVTISSNPGSRTGTPAQTAPSNSQTPENTPPQPPDPHQLPSPSSLRIMPQPQGKSMANGDLPSGKAQSPKKHQDRVVPLQSPAEVECVVHGTYYASWSGILQQGLVKPNQRSHIPCYPFVPINTGAPYAYQLFVFINVQQAMMDGIKFFKGERQILCSGDARGCLPPKYFSKVVDSESREIIYPQQVGSNLNGPPPNNRQGMVGLGRGGPISSNQPPQTIQLYENIWSQVQRLDTDNVNLRPFQAPKLFACNQQPQQPSHPNPNPGRMEVSVQDIFRGAANHQQHHPQHQPQHHPHHHPQHHPYQPMHLQHHQARQQHQQHHHKQQQPQGEPNIMSLLTAAAAAQQSQTLATPTPPATHKNGSPAKSAFVPTQVIRNQTPRKPRGNDVAQAERSEPGANSPKKQQQQQKKEQGSHQQQQKQHQKQGAEGTAKPRRQVRNRLAVRFDQAPGKD